MLSEESGTSSKRVNGTFCIFVVAIITALSVVLEWTIASPQQVLLDTVFWGGIALLGITAVEKFIKK